jgi:hypothetical protein
MQADCFVEYLQCLGKNTTGELAPDLACTSTLISCVKLCERPSLRQPG